MSLNWNFEPPPPSEFADREVRLTGSHLSGKQIALLMDEGYNRVKDCRYEFYIFYLKVNGYNLA